MKPLFILLSALITVYSANGCKSKKSTTASATSGTVNSTSSTPGESGNTMETTNTSTSGKQGAHAGKVSHKYRATGCETVIIINAYDEVAEIVLIPKDKLNKDIDVDGQNLTFDYLPLKMPQPAGCTTGIPAEITNITKLK